MDPDDHVALIVGGMDRQLNYEQLDDYLCSGARRVSLIQAPTNGVGDRARVRQRHPSRTHAGAQPRGGGAHGRGAARRRRRAAVAGAASYDLFTNYEAKAAAYCGFIDELAGAVGAAATNLEPVPDPATYRPAPGSIPVEPGVYRFRDPHGRVIYVGKAKSLRSRLNSYFADLSGLAPRTRQMVMTAGSVEWTVVGTEVEALQLEYNWIKEFDPRFNIRYRDDKSYPVLAVTLNEEYPRLFVYRGPRRKGVRYFGPYSHAWAIRETLDLLTRVFPARTCSAGVFKRHNQIGRPCLLGYIDKCSAPCVGRVSAEEHRRIVLDFCDFLAGKTDRLARDMEQQMNAAAAELDFERAARLRDNIWALKRALEKQTVVFGDGTDADVVAFADDELEAAVQVFHVRGGRVRGQRGWVVEKSGEPGKSGQEHLVEQFLTQFYGDQAELGGAADEATNLVPRQVLVPVLPDNAEELADVAVRAAGLEGADAGAAARRQAGAGRDGAPQCAGGAGAAQAQARR